MTTKKNNENLLQEIFDFIWYKFFPDPKDKFTLEEYEKLFPTLPEIIEFKLPKRTPKEGIFITLGETFKNKPITLDLKENPHSYITGTTGSGKSVITKAILTSLVTTYKPSELEIYLADPKRVELNLFRNTMHCKKFVYEIQDITELIADLLAETNKRYDLFMKYEVTNIFEYNKLPGVTKLKYQVLYIEEIVMLLEDRKKNAMRLLKQLIAISRASGLYIFLTTQRPSNDVIDNVVKANINNRIALKCEDSKNSIVALDSAGAENLRGNGHGIIKRGCNLEEFQGYFITDTRVKELIKPFIKPKNKNKYVDNKLISKDNKTSHNPNKQATDTKEEPSKNNKIIDLDFLKNI